MGIKCPIGHIELEIGDWGLGKSIGYFSNSSRNLLCIASLLEQSPVLMNSHFLTRCGGEVGVGDEDVEEGDLVVNGHTFSRQIMLG